MSSKRMKLGNNDTIVDFETNGSIIVGDPVYGEELPSSGEEGQVFYKAGEYDVSDLIDYEQIESDISADLIKIQNAEPTEAGNRIWITDGGTFRIKEQDGAYVGIDAIRGEKGDTGAVPTISIGTVAAGEAPSVTAAGTLENVILNFTLQKGDKGDQGDIGPKPVKGVDYYTETDKADFVTDVITALPTYGGYVVVEYDGSITRG